MPEATFICIDSSDYMRNGDYSPSRIMACQEACSLLCEALMQRNPENVIGFLTFGGKTCSVRETLTEDIDRVSGSLASIAVGGESHFAYGIQIAMLALSHCKNTRSQKHIVAFCGSPITDSPDRLRQLATALRKDDVGVSILSLGVPANTPILQQFTEQVQKNASLYVVPEHGSVIDFLFTTSLMGGDGGSSGGSGGAGGGNVGVPGGFGPEADDPQFAMAIRASLEEEQRRQAAAAAAGNNNSDSNAQANATTASSTSNTNNNTGGGGDAAITSNQDAAPEDDLELALRLSMEEALRAEQQQTQQETTKTTSDGAPTTQPPAQTGTGGGGANEMAEFEAAIQDPEVMKMLQQISSDEKKKDDNDKKDDKDKKDGDKK